MLLFWAGTLLKAMSASRMNRLKGAAEKQLPDLPLDRSACAAFSRALLGWYRLHARDLPWRRDPDPYRTWVSEIMLQQTRVNAVLEHYRAFVERFPTSVSLALASEEEVLSRWSGLGYYRRARLLHRAAKFLLQEHEGTLPRTAEELRKLPGIGAYTGAAIASIAFGERIAVVDGNVERVLLRVAGRPEEANRSTADFITHFAQTLIKTPVQNDLSGPPDEAHPPGDHNQAMMELGATVCLPRGPHCLECPVVRWCATRGEHVTPARAAMRSERVSYALVTRNTGAGEVEVLLRRRSAELSLMAGMLELPAFDALPESEPMLRLRHAIVGTNYYAEVYATSDSREMPRGTPSNGQTEWYKAANLTRLPLTGLARKVLQRVGVMTMAGLPALARSVAHAATGKQAEPVSDMPLLIGIHGLISDGTEDSVIPTHRAAVKADGMQPAAQKNSAQGEEYDS